MSSKIFTAKGDLENAKILKDGSAEDSKLHVQKLYRGTPASKFCFEDAGSTLSLFNSSAESGLNDYIQRAKQYGANELIISPSDSLFMCYIKNFVGSPLNLLLIASAGISTLLRNFDDAVSILVSMIIVVTVGFVQEYKSEQSLEALNFLVPQFCNALRDGALLHIPATRVVPGDIIVLHAGDRVPADIRLISSSELECDESHLTGETESIHKNAATLDFDERSEINHLSQRSNICYMGTVVLAGHGKGVVIATATDTEFGRIFLTMQEVEKPKTPLQKSMDDLGTKLSYASFVVIGLIVLFGFFQGRKILEMFTIGVSLAVAAIPEGLPIIVTVTLAIGVLRMAKHKSIIRHLPSVETLGSVNMICSDKTGTLTMNKLIASSAFTISDETFHDFNIDIGLDRPLFTQNKVLKQILLTGNICNNSQIGHSSFGKRTEWKGQAIDVSIMNLLARFGMDDRRNFYSRVEDLPYSSERKYMMVRVISDDSKCSALYMKGSMEKVLEHSKFFLALNGEKHPMTSNLRATVIKAEKLMASKGLRILAFAYAEEETIESKNLCFLGLIGMYDPPRQGVQEAIETLRTGGVKVMMITGDSPSTAVSIARQLGFPIPSNLNSDSERTFVLQGEDIDRLNAEQLRICLKNVTIFARTTARHKMKIVKALQMDGDIVAMTGDGVNDAPALKLADIGISMGISGTDVAKEAADMILTDDSFPTILHAIEEGKAIFVNIQNFVSFQLSTSIAALMLVALATLFGLNNPLNAMQILWINILMDGPPAQSLGVEPVDADVMQKPPRPRNSPILTWELIERVLLIALCIVVGTLFVFIKELDEEGSVTKKANTMTFTCFVFFDMFSALGHRSSQKSITNIGLFSNKMFTLSVFGSLIGQGIVIYIPMFQRIFQTEALNFKDIAILIIISSTVLIADELRKRFRRKNRNFGVITQIAEQV